MTSCVMSDQPLVSVIIPAYNAEAFIRETLRSVLAQTYTNLEVLVVDDGSRDRTAEIVEGFVKQDARVKLLQQLNAGVAAARNLAIQHAKGEFVAPIDADDIWYPENIAKQVQCFADSSLDVGLVYSWSLDIDEGDCPTEEIHAARVEGSVYLTLLCHYFLANASASLIRRSCLQAIGGYDCQFKKKNAQGCEDWDLYLRLAEQFEFQVVPEFLVGYRKLQHSMSCNYISMGRSHDLMLQLIRQKHPEIPDFVYRLSSSSFYIHLAQQSSKHDDNQVTLFWLQKALKVDWFFSFLRPELYTLSFMSLLKLRFQAIAPLTKLSDRAPKRLRERHHKLISNRNSPFNVNQKTLKQSKSILEILLHRFLPILVFITSCSRVKSKKFQYRLTYKRGL